MAHPAAIGGEEWLAETATVITFARAKSSICRIIEPRTRL